MLSKFAAVSRPHYPRTTLKQLLVYGKTPNGLSACNDATSCQGSLNLVRNDTDNLVRLHEKLPCFRSYPAAGDLIRVQRQASYSECVVAQSATCCDLGARASPELPGL